MSEQRVVYIVIDPTKARTGSAAVVNSLRNIENATDRVNKQLAASNKAVQGFTRSFNRLQMILLAAQPIRFLGGFLRELVEADKLVTAFKAQMFTVTGDMVQSAEAFDHLKRTAQAYAVPLTSITKGYAKLRASMDFDHLRKYNEALFQSTVILSSVLHLPEYNSERVFNVMIQIMSKGQLMMEELKQQLGEHVPGAITLAAQAMGYTVEQMMDKMQKGLISAEEFASGWSKLIIEKFGPAAEMSTKSIQSSINRFRNVITESMIDMAQSESGFAISQMILSLVAKLDGASDHFKTFGLLVAEVALDIRDFIDQLTPEDVDNFFRSVVNVGKAFLDLLSFIGLATVKLSEHRDLVKLATQAFVGFWVATHAQSAALALMTNNSIAATWAVSKLTTALAIMTSGVALAGAGYIGWSIGSWLHDEFEIVQKVGNRMAKYIHLFLADIGMRFEVFVLELEQVFTNPLTKIKQRIVGFLNFLDSIGEGAQKLLGIPDTVKPVRDAIKNWLTDEDVEENIARMEKLKAGHVDKLESIVKIYDELYKNIGSDNSDDTSDDINERLDIDPDILEKYKQLRAELQALADSDEKFINGLSDQSKEFESVSKSVKDLIDDLDPLGAAFEDLRIKQELLMQARGLKIISTAEMERYIKLLVDKVADAGDEAAQEFINPFTKAAENMSKSVGDAIIKGEWSSIGEALGSTLSAGIGSAIEVTVTDSIQKSLGEITADSGLFTQLGSAFAGLLAGAIGGALAQVAFDKIGSFLSLGDWDPTEMRQAAQGTGTILGSIDEKSQSISKGMDVTASATNQLVGINRSMLRALEQVNIGIQGASARMARGASGVSFVAPGVRENMFGVSGFAGDLIGAMPGAEFAVDNAFSAGFNMLTLGLGKQVGKLLGGKSRQVDEGINIVGGYIGDLVDDVVVQSFATFRVKKNAFSSTKTKEKYQNLGNEVTDQFGLVFESVLDSVIASAGALGIDASAANGFEVGTQKLSLEGLDAAAQLAELEAYFGTVFDNLAAHTIPWLDEFQRAGEGLGETLTRVATQTQATQYAIDAMGIRFDDLAGRDLVHASERLIEFSGGLEQFISGMQSFIGNFATEEQQFELNQRNLNKAMAEANLQLPETRQGFYELMQVQNGSTEAGAENIATLLRLQGVADQYYTSLEDSAKELAATAEELLSSLRGNTDSALSQLKASIDARKNLLQEALNAQIDQINEETKARLNGNRLAIEAAKAGLSAIREELSGITRATDSLRDSYEPIQGSRRQNALALLARAIETGDLTGTGAAAEVAAKIEESAFGSASDYLYEQARTLNTLSTLQEDGESQLTTAELAVKRLEKQTDAIRDASQRQIEQARSDLDSELSALDKLYAEQVSQVNALRGIEEGVLSIADAIAQLASALNQERPSAIERAYSIAGVAADASGKSYWDSEIKAGNATIADLEYRLWVADKENRDWWEAQTGQKVPGYAAGGMHSGGLRLVGENGPELEVTGPSRIFSNSQSRNMLDMSEVVSELRQVKAELAQIKQASMSTANHTSKSSRQLERWDIDGMPEERVIV